MNYESIEYDLPMHQGEHGNLTARIIDIVVPNGAVATDTLALRRIPWRHRYRRLSVESAGNSGLTLDIGVTENQGPIGGQDGAGDAPATNTTLFATAQATTTAGTAEVLDHPVRVVKKADGTLIFDTDTGGMVENAVAHDLVVTLGGTVTAGERAFIVLEMLFEGAPA